jgi:hypothetical protein
MTTHLIVSKGNIVNAKTMRIRTVRTVITRILLTLMAIGAALAAMAIAQPPAAHADMVNYPSRLQDAGYTGPITKWMNTGNAICRLEAQGYSRSDIAVGIVATTGAGIYRAEALEIIQIADEELCFTNVTATV